MIVPWFILLDFPILSQKKLDNAADASADFRFAAAVSYFGHLLKRRANAGDYSMPAVRELAAASEGNDASGKRQEFVDMVSSAAELLGQNQAAMR